MAIRKTKAIQTSKTIAHFALLGLAAAVLVKIYKTANTYDELGKKMKAEGIKIKL